MLRTFDVYAVVFVVVAVVAVVEVGVVEKGLEAKVEGTEEVAVQGGGKSGHGNRVGGGDNGGDSRC